MLVWDGGVGVALEDVVEGRVDDLPPPRLLPAATRHRRDSRQLVQRPADLRRKALLLLLLKLIIDAITCILY